MEKYELLQKIENFWDQKNQGANDIDFQKFEASCGIQIPKLIKKLYGQSNGGFPEFGFVKNGERYHSLFPTWIPPIEEFELFKDYVSGFNLDDEETLDFLKHNTEAVIWYRHGFEFFVLFWANKDNEKCDLGLLDLAAPPGDPSRCVRFQLGNDPVGFFARSVS